MAETLINLMIQLLAGAIGGNAAGAAFKDYGLGMLGNTIAGAIGGGVVGQTLQALLQMIEEKQKLLELLNEYIDGPGLTVVIGAEHLNPNLRPFSLVLSTYNDGSGIGTVGVIGPTRMHYSRAIAAVDGAAQAVSRVLRDPN